MQEIPFDNIRRHSKRHGDTANITRRHPSIGAKKSTQTFFVQSFSTTLRVMDVRAENRGRPHQKVRFPAAPVVGRNFLTPGHPGVRVRNVRGKSGPESLCLCCFSSLTNYPQNGKKSERIKNFHRKRPKPQNHFSEAVVKIGTVSSTSGPIRCLPSCCRTIVY